MLFFVIFEKDNENVVLAFTDDTVVSLLKRPLYEIN